MSYILDALQKAEADRDPDTRASLALAQHAQNRQRLLGYGLIAALLANALILVWLFFPGSPPDPSPADTTPAAAIEGRQIAPAVRQERPRETTTVTSVEPPPRAAEAPAVPGATTTDSPGRTVATPRPSAVPSIEPRSRRVAFAALPAAARARFPELSFSMHIHGDLPAQSAVVVNGTRLEPGDAIEGLTVHEITETGAVFRFEDYLVEVPVLQNWD